MTTGQRRKVRDFALDIPARRYAAMMGVSALACSLAGGPAGAQGAPAASMPIEVVTITAQKRGIQENVQTVPIAVTAVTGIQVEQQQVRTLQDLNTAAPNVTLADAGTIPGFANFTIRGLGTNSTIPSVEPTVGVFVDGVYLGMSAGIVLDLFDLEDVEILRGPQGLLFGRNTTGGAILINTRRPGGEVAVRGRASYESGPQGSAGFSVEGPASAQLRLKLAGYYSNDRGWFENSFDGSRIGEERTGFVRPMLVWTPGRMLDATLIYERGWTRGDGAVAQNPAFFHGFDVGINNRGYNKMDWNALTLQTNVDVPAGVITNVLGYRDLAQGASSDIDAQPVSRFQGLNVLEQNQFSEELRFAGRFWGRADVTAGLYYFAQDYFYLERRVLLGGLIDSTMGATMADSNYAGFAQLDVDVTPEFSLIGGGRYTVEEKSARIATFVPSTAGSRCNFTARTCTYNFPGPAFPGAPGNETWKVFTPKLGFAWQTANRLIYGSWSRGARSGGYNVRNTSFVVPPGPYGPERQDAFELGLKSDWLDGRLRANGALFYNELKDLQRDVNLPDPVVGVVQVTRNTADATIKGFEAELIAALGSTLTLEANLGYTDGQYDAIFFDLDGGGIGASDRSLSIPRLSKWSYQIGAVYSDELRGGYGMQLRAAYGYRSPAAYTDNNTTFLAPVKDLSVGAAFTLPDGHWRFSLYGRNLLDKVTDGVVTPLPPTLGGGAFRTLNEGRSIGISASFAY